jgi:hypothetical protein
MLVYPSHVLRFVSIVGYPPSCTCSLDLRFRGAQCVALSTVLGMLGPSSDHGMPPKHFGDAGVAHVWLLPGR